MSDAYKIKRSDFDAFVSRERGNKVELIWSDIVINLDEKHRREAKEKGFSLTEAGKYGKTHTKFVLEIPGASKTLQKSLGRLNTVLMSM